MAMQCVGYFDQRGPDRKFASHVAVDRINSSGSGHQEVRHSREQKSAPLELVSRYLRRNVIRCRRKPKLCLVKMTAAVARGRKTRPNKIGQFVATCRYTQAKLRENAPPSLNLARHDNLAFDRTYSSTE